MPSEGNCDKCGEHSWRLFRCYENILAAPPLNLCDECEKKWTMENERNQMTETDKVSREKEAIEWATKNACDLDIDCDPKDYENYCSDCRRIFWAAVRGYIAAATLETNSREEEAFYAGRKSETTNFDMANALTAGGVFFKFGTFADYQAYKKERRE